MKTLKLLPGGAGSKLPELRLGGAAPAEDMAPGQYLAVCEGAWIEPVGQAVRIVLQFRCVDGK